MLLIAKKDFSYSTDGCTLVHYAAGAEIHTDHAELIQVATEQGWADSPAKKAPENKARKQAPENKSE